MNPENQNYHKITLDNTTWLREDLSFIDRLLNRLAGAVVKRISFDEWLNESVCADRNRMFK